MAAAGADDLRRQVEKLRQEFDAAVAVVRDPATWQGVHDRFLGRKAGAVTALLKSLGQLAAEVRRDAGSELNALKADFERRLSEAKQSLGQRVQDERLARERLDITLPGRAQHLGRRHPL